MRISFLLIVIFFGVGFSAYAQEEDLVVPTVEELTAEAVQINDAIDVAVQPDTGLLDTPDSIDLEVEESPIPTPPHSGLYYDSDSIVQDSVFGPGAGTREIDPKYEPGSRFVVVQKDAGPNSLQAQMIAAERALKLKRYSSALELYEGLYKRSPRNNNVLMGLAIAQQQSGFLESAIATYEELLKVDPNNTNATVNMLGIIRAQYPAIAYRKLKDLWERNRRSPAIAAQLGLTSAENGNSKEALQYLGIAASLEPNNALHYYNMAVVVDRVGESKEALMLYQKALEVDVAYGNSKSIPRDQIYDRLAHLRRL